MTQNSSSGLGDRAHLTQPLESSDSTPLHKGARQSAHPSSSPDFGVFIQAPVPGPSRIPPSNALRSHSGHQAMSLLDDDVDTHDFRYASHLEPNQPVSRASSQNLTPSSTEIDLLGGDTWEDATPQTRKQSIKAPPSTPHPRPQHDGRAASPVHIPLPPRPSEISPDYVPPLRSPRRLSSYSFGLSSPPIITDAGNDIIFHPSQQTEDDNAVSEMRKVQQRSDSSQIGASSHSPEKSAQGLDLHRSVTRSPPHHSKLLDTLATTTRLASKWRSAITNTTFSPPHHASPPEQHSSPTPRHAEPLPIDVTHETPFATPEQIAGSYRAPSGAPGFNPHQVATPKYKVGDDDEWGRIKLLGRRESTVPILEAANAVSLRHHLPPRQRLSSAWTLLFSLDQHGASLSTMYRLIDRFGQTHKTSGNVLIVCDAHGNRFGVFMNECIAKREGTYYGSGESFLFKLNPLSEPQVFKWTGKNQYFALCEAGFISFGGGDGKYGLLLDSTFTQNSSATSPAYDNDVLSDSIPRKSNQAWSFDCVGLEVWGT
ncbi:uncharacterized protein I303_106778 [Kwoniella dejecticola CBS 10117]|uniref:Oxidation resistance protein 1 n=1 Tax=Kwoniella dejecticola CBS 10117 TaxID=1296121 RepID=A0A1A5ZTU0_9TREE|nr:uncharacterized protein I303_08580 [Kwoniella dejecticola CBS 10117]OBR81195.1 hypothetical protein I303_08580 [Kwoniella dejecticola CBS 10117]